MRNSNLFLVFTYFILSVVVLSVFAFRSYAYAEETHGYRIILGIIIPFIVALVIRQLLQKPLVSNAHPLYQPRRQLILDLGFYLLVASALLIQELLFYHHEWIIAVQMFTWALMTGYFASLDSALERERTCFQHVQDSEPELDCAKGSVAHRLNLFFSLTVLIAILACALSAYGYLSIGGEVIDAKEAFIVDILFIISIVISLTVRLIYSYSLNMQHLFDSQVNGLRSIQRGELESYVPVLSRDEFGVIAQQTNNMIDELREKQKIQKTLEQIVSPDIMHKLLHGNKNDLKQGQEFEIAILFCDLRKFTTYTENTPADEVIYFLNAYFTKVADIVAEHNGIINKFMGDAILAVYGVDGDDHYIEDAMNTAWDILMHSDCVKTQNGTTFDIGIGLHRGLATACTIGSSDRYEYTFIGDSVNTASRLDGLSKQLGYKIVTSSEVYDELSDDAQSRFFDLGAQAIRGKSATIHAYGAFPKKQTTPEKPVNNIIHFKTSGG